MTIDYSTPGKVVFCMEDYINQMVDECPKELLKGSPMSPAANHLFDINPDCDWLDVVVADEFHHFIAKLLCLKKLTRTDILLEMAFLCTWVKGPDTDDYKKLGHCMSSVKANERTPSHP